MAGLRFKVPFGPVQLVASSFKTLVQIKAPTNQRVKITKVFLGFDGISATDPIPIIEFARQTTAGTGGRSITPSKGEQEASRRPLGPIGKVTQIASDRPTRVPHPSRTQSRPGSSPCNSNANRESLCGQPSDPRTMGAKGRRFRVVRWPVGFLGMARF